MTLTPPQSPPGSSSIVAEAGSSSRGVAEGSASSSREAAVYLQRAERQFRDSRYVRVFNAFGNMNGEGILEFPNGDIYEGEFKDGNPDGFGIYRYPNGDMFIGEWKNGRAHGYGKYLNKEENVLCEGLWEQDTYYGKYVNVLVSPGCVRETFIKEENTAVCSRETYAEQAASVDERNVKVKKKITCFDGSTYQGEFKDGQPHGFGTEKPTDNSEYAGHWLNGNYHGNEILMDDNVIYHGTWNSGQDEEQAVKAVELDSRCGNSECTDSFPFEQEWVDNSPGGCPDELGSFDPRAITSDYSDVGVEYENAGLSEKEAFEHAIALSMSQMVEPEV